jgi:hypothetical protein
MLSNIIDGYLSVSKVLWDIWTFFGRLAGAGAENRVACRSIFLLIFSALAHPPKEKYSVNKKTRVSLLENLYGWLGAQVSEPGRMPV